MASFAALMVKVITGGEVARVLVDSRSGLADARVVDILHLGLSVGMLKDIVVNVSLLDGVGLVGRRLGGSLREAGEANGSNQRLELHFYALQSSFSDWRYYNSEWDEQTTRGTLSFLCQYATYVRFGS